MSETSFLLHGEKLAQILSPAFMRRRLYYTLIHEKGYETISCSTFVA